ncbi:hypothetical protein MRBLMN1_005376 [Chitinophaga ginsengisegetis]|uniref:hypothetical protein n=1 Tax=Chitinophaga ginsengisegetis TaxID=393003 RepID=UPI003435D1B4
MKKSILISILIPIAGCTGQKEKVARELFNDKSGFCIKAQLPEEWSDYKGIRAFLDEDFIFQNIKGAKDTLSWIVLRVYEFKSVEQSRFNIDSILNWQINLAQTENKTTHLLSKNVNKRSSGKVIGYFDFTTKNANRLDYSRLLVFFQRKKIGVLELHHRVNQDTFLKIANLITESLDY